MQGEFVARSIGAHMEKTNGCHDLHTFSVVLSGTLKHDSRLEDALFEAGCGDAVLLFRKSVAYLEFDREADCFESAIISAIQNIESAAHEVTVSHIEPADVVNASEIARRLHKTREYVRLLTQGRRGEGGFPAPLSGVTSTISLWSWASVMNWFVQHNKVDDDESLSQAKTIRDINNVISIHLSPTIIKRQKLLLRKLKRA